MATELTSEQIVTELLVSNEILKAPKVVTKSNKEHDLGKFIINEAEKRKETKKSYRYTFIDPDGWSF